MKIYLDIFFAVNFLMNLLILEIMNIFLKKRLVINMRSIAAAALGAFFAGIVVVSGSRDRFVIFIIMYVFVSGLMMRLAYGKTTVGGMAGYIAGYYVSGIHGGGSSVFEGDHGHKKYFHNISFAVSHTYFIFDEKDAFVERQRDE